MCGYENSRFIYNTIGSIAGLLRVEESELRYLSIPCYFLRTYRLIGVLDVVAYMLTNRDTLLQRTPKEQADLIYSVAVRYTKSTILSSVQEIGD